MYLVLISSGLWVATNKKTAGDFYLDLIISAVLIYFLVKNEFRKDNANAILCSFCIFAAAVSIFGFIEMITGKNILYQSTINNIFYNRFIEQKRMMSTLIHPNVLGSYLLPCAPIPYYLYYSGRSIVNVRYRFTILIFSRKHLRKIK